jgi:hypothetical protein
MLKESWIERVSDTTLLAYYEIVFTEAEGSLPCTQKLIYLDFIVSQLDPLYTFRKIHFNIIDPSGVMNRPLA